jgi:hypothetical protein
MALRRSLLNHEISLQARIIAHETTKSCHGENLPDHPDHHTPKCNKLKARIEDMALQVKLAGLQREARRVAIEVPALVLEG